MEPDEGIEHEQDRPHRGDGGLQLLAVVGEIEPETGHGDDVDRQVRERHAGRAANALEPRPHEMQGIFGGIEQHGPPTRRREPAQTRDAGGDGHDHIEREEALPAFRLAADNTDGLVGPQVLD